MTAKAIEGTGQNDFWHYAVGSDRRGPVPRPTLAKLLASGEISAETYVWQPGMDNWVHLGDAAPLKALVAGIEGDSGPEDFVEEDTTFTTAEELNASHKQLDRVDEGLSQDTIVEPAPYTIPMGSKSKPVTAPAPTVVAAPEPAPAKPAANDDIFGAASAPAASSGGSDIFSAAVTTQAAQSSSDIFATGSPAAEDENIAGVHGRRQSSVLFSLDELGREDGKKGPGGGGGNEAFVTDSSGLIDIKAVATSHKPVQSEDPFGGSGPALVMPPRASAPGAMAIPIARKRSMGPWLLAAVALIVGGGVALALILTGNKDPKPEPLAQNQVQPAPKEEPKPTPAPDPKVAEPKVAEPKAATPEPKPAEVKPEAVAGADGATPTTNPATPEANPGAAGTAPTPGTVEKKPAEKKPAEKPSDKIEVKPTEKKPTEDKIVVAEVKPPKSTTENTAKVNDILGKLSPGDKGEDKAKTADGGDTGLPDKLSAAVVRNTIKGKFGSCGSMVTTGGPVSVMTSFVIAGSGVVQSARVTDAAGVGSDVQRCVVGVIKGTTFGKFKEATMTVNLPVKLL